MLVPYSNEGNATLFQYVFPNNTLLQLFAIIEYVRFASLFALFIISSLWVLNMLLLSSSLIPKYLIVSTNFIPGFSFLLYIIILLFSLFISSPYF